MEIPANNIVQQMNLIDVHDIGQYWSIIKLHINLDMMINRIAKFATFLFVDLIWLEVLPLRAANTLIKT